MWWSLRRVAACNLRTVGPLGRFEDGSGAAIHDAPEADPNLIPPTRRIGRPYAFTSLPPAGGATLDSGTQDS